MAGALVLLGAVHAEDGERLQPGERLGHRRAGVAAAADPVQGTDLVGGVRAGGEQDQSDDARQPAGAGVKASRGAGV